VATIVGRGASKAHENAEPIIIELGEPHTHVACTIASKGQYFRRGSEFLVPGWIRALPAPFATTFSIGNVEVNFCDEYVFFVSITVE
jgi:hypothetical protein